MEQVIPLEEFERVVGWLVGKPLWDTVAGPTTATAVLLKFGAKIPVKDVRGNSMQQEAERFEGELSLMVWCSWRVEMGQTELLCGCGDPYNAGGPMLTGLQKLPGDVVSDVSINPFLDLLVAFESGRRLRLFCDRSKEYAYGCYCLFVNGTDEEICYAAEEGVVKCEREPGPA